MQRAGSRATFRSRGPTFAGRRARLASFKVQPPFEPTRLRSRLEARSKRVRPCERTSLPAWQPEPTNWCHGSPAGHAWSLQARGLPPSSPDGRRSESGFGSAEGHLPFASTVPGNHRAGPYDPRGARYGRTEYGRPRCARGRIPGTGKGLTGPRNGHRPQTHTELPSSCQTEGTGMLKSQLASDLCPLWVRMCDWKRYMRML